MSVPSPPLCDITPTVPSSVEPSSTKVTRPRGEYIPRQFGPSSRRPPARAARTSSSCSALPSSTSPNPLEITCAKRTRPFASASIFGTCRAATEM
jgi:hypothetical protein